MFEWLNDRGDPDVAAALRKRCTLCGAKPGEDCRNLCGGKPLPGGRLVHMFRTELWAKGTRP